MSPGDVVAMTWLMWRMWVTAHVDLIVAGVVAVVVGVTVGIKLSRRW